MQTLQLFIVLRITLEAIRNFRPQRADSKRFETTRTKRDEIKIDPPRRFPPRLIQRLRFRRHRRKSATGREGTKRAIERQSGWKILRADATRKRDCDLIDANARNTRMESAEGRGSDRRAFLVESRFSGVGHARTP